jgi:hypothetical protein
MNALTYEIRNAATLVAGTKTPKSATEAKGFWARVWDAMIEARMRQAEREIRMHLHLIPADVLAQSGLSRTLKDSGKLPFVK